MAMRYWITIFLIFITSSALAQKATFAYGSIAKHEANVRSGPGTQYPILWIYKQRGWPVMILAEYFNWYKIRDMEGEEGWVYKSLLSKRRTVVVNDGDAAPLYNTSAAHTLKAYLKPGVITELLSCNAFMCHVALKGSDGWLSKERLLMLEDGY